MNIGIQAVDDYEYEPQGYYPGEPVRLTLLDHPTYQVNPGAAEALVFIVDNDEE